MSTDEAQEMSRRISMEIYGSSGDIHRLGTFSGHELFHAYVAHGEDGSRASVYVHAVPMHAGEASFTQVSSVKRDLVEDRSERSIERLLIFDAVERIKRRLLDHSHQKGQVYTADLSRADIERSARKAA